MTFNVTSIPGVTCDMHVRYTPYTKHYWWVNCAFVIFVHLSYDLNTVVVTSNMRLKDYYHRYSFLQQCVRDEKLEEKQRI